MASLTPGVLSKLLQNVGNSNVKVAGEHRSALLQVIGIVPSLGDDPWESRGFFLRVSDSMHSAYVSISDGDSDMIFSDKIQLGQFIHVTRLDSGSPVPVLRGVKPLPRRRPCVGNPQDLISSDSLSIRTRVEFSTAKKGLKSAKRDGVKRVEAKVKRLACEDSKSRRLSLGNGKVEGLELRRLSLESSRKGWDQSPLTKNGLRPIPRFKSQATSSSLNCSVLPGKKASPEKDLALKHPSLSILPFKNRNNIESQKLISKPLRKDSQLSLDDTTPNHLIKVPLSFKTWSDRKISWDLLPPPIQDLGKETMSHRNVAFFAAVRALEEASATERVIQCMSMFAELCELSQKDSEGPLVEQFLNLYQNMQKAAAVIDALCSSRCLEAESNTYSSSQCSLAEACKNFTNKNALSWLQAAVETDLSKFCLFTKEDKRNLLNDEKCYHVVLENTSKKIESENHTPQNKQSPRNHHSFVSNSSAKGFASHSRQHLSSTKKTNVERKEWSEGNGLKVAASLAGKLLLVSRAWFLNYLEESLNKGFGVRRGEEGSEVSGLLGQLKRVNQWLDDPAGDGSGIDKRIEGLRKKLYGFLLEHVDSAAVVSR